MSRKSDPAKSATIVHVYSTLVAGQDFTVYAKGGADMPVVVKTVRINGGASVADKKVITPMGAYTSVSAEDYNLIKDLEHFQGMVKRGHIRVEGTFERDIERIAIDMNRADPSRPVTPEMYAIETKTEDARHQRDDGNTYITAPAARAAA